MPSKIKTFDKNTMCRRIGCLNNNHQGFVIRKDPSSAAKWIEWLKQGGIDEQSFQSNKSLRICFRHFKREFLFLGDKKFRRLKLATLAFPTYYPNDQKSEEDSEWHMRLSKVLGEKNSVVPIEVVLTKPVKDITKKVLEPQKALDFESLFKTASAVEKGLPNAYKLVVVDSVVHEAASADSNGEAQLAMLEIREAILNHSWDVALQLLPMIAMQRCSLHFIWQCYLQIFCHHPNSTPELLKEMLQVCMQTSNISHADLREIFCLKDMPSDEVVSELFKMDSSDHKRASVVHKLVLSDQQKPFFKDLKTV